ncbi:hypothetical protein [Burkholderia ambifaria]|uniref:Uncharacterized protein n=1 Tax=Burkholderia ambifaria MEX-5 TaxID=396597 RepID=B1T2Q1_9BURK|nr:hypothetical protein [Burkholderia ambifaria]EDT42130.1 hypothetical protein BamMEX5DRAFT_2067 [Burkholderia ambifaria MEX-5]
MARYLPEPTSDELRSLIDTAVRDINAWHWKDQALDAHQRRIKQLEKIVFDQARRLDTMSGAANDGHDNPANPPPRPKTVAR